jgi:hypothetical protein
MRPNQTITIALILVGDDELSVVERDLSIKFPEIRFVVAHSALDESVGLHHFCSRISPPTPCLDLVIVARGDDNWGLGLWGGCNTSSNTLPRSLIQVIAAHAVLLRVCVHRPPTIGYVVRSLEDEAGCMNAYQDSFGNRMMFEHSDTPLPGAIAIIERFLKTKP